MQNKYTLIYFLVWFSFLSTLSTQIWPELIFKYWFNNFHYIQWDYLQLFIQIFTSQFIHWDYFHFIFNAIFIFIFWKYVIDIIWWKKTTLFFIFSSIIIWIFLLLFSSSTTVWMSWFALWLLSFYWLELFKNNNTEYKWAIFAIVLNILIWFTPGVSFLWHLAGVISWILFYVIYKIFINIKHK